MSTATRFASIDDFAKGGVEIIGDEDPKRYLFSNMFEVAANAAPWLRTVVAKNLEFTIECIRAEGVSPWYVCGHDETALLMQGEAVITFIKPDQQDVVPDDDHAGAIKLGEQAPSGARMGQVKLGRGHMALLPAGAAYQIEAKELGVILLQSIQGDEAVERWAEICQK